MTRKFLAVIARIKAALDQQISAIDRAVDGDIAGLSGLRAKLQPLRPDIGRIASRTIQLAAELRDRIRETDLSRAEQAAWLILGLAFLSFVFLLIIWLQFARTEKQRAELVALTANLRQATSEAEEANRAKSEFLAHMSHELRTPLNSILGFSEIIRDGVMGKCEPKAYAEYAGIINQSSQHLLGLIEGLLDLSRIEVKKLELEEEEIELGPMIDLAVTLIEENAARNGISVDVRHATSEVTILADARRMRQMLLNLLDNAVKFSDPGGEIKVATLLFGNGDLSISIGDQGRGIPERDLGAILEPFHRGTIGSYNATTGVGPGLSIVQALIKMHEGSLQIESEVSKGTTVQLRFPACRVRPKGTSQRQGTNG